MTHTFEQYGDILTPKEVREILGVGANKIYELLKSGAIKNFQVGRSRKIPKEFLLEYIRDSVAGSIHTHIQGDKNNDGNIENQR